MKKWFLIGCLGFLPLFSWAQEMPEVERLLESNDILRSEEGFEDMVNTLVQLKAHPLNLNTAGFDSLKMLLFLSDSQIDNILAFRKKYRMFLYPEELLLVKGMGKKDLENILPFITLTKGERYDRRHAIKSRTSREIITRIRTSFPVQEGYKSYLPKEFKNEEQYLKKKRNRFQGPPLGSFVKYKMQYRSDWQFGLTLENDPGEAYFTRYQKTGFDFLSAYASLTTPFLVRRVLVGDYRVQWGQGLVAWGGFSSGKSAAALSNEKSGRGFSPYTSTDENNFLRGVALSLQPLEALSAEVFFSYKKTDGNLLDIDSLAEEDILTASLYQSGYHRNESECEKKDRLKELTTGVNLTWNNPFFKLGVHTLYYDFKPEIEVGGEVYKLYADRGSHRFLTGINYKTGWQNLYFFGETAFTEDAAVATVNGLRFSGSSRMALCLLYRRYDKKYISHYASGFGEYSNTSNEEGFYLGVELSPVKNIRINAYHDYFRFFSSRYNALVPGSGCEMLIEARAKQSALEHLLRCKYEEKPENQKGVTWMSASRKRTELRYQLGWKATGCWELRTRADFVLYRKADIKEKGYMVYGDMIYTALKKNFKMQFRMAYFNTDSYQSRIYAYENNVLYGYSFPAYFDEGMRTYVNMNLKAGKWLTFYLKSGFTFYPDREQISSGLTSVSGNKLVDLTLQLRMRF